VTRGSRSEASELVAWKYRLRQAQTMLWAGEIEGARKKFAAFIDKFPKLRKRYEDALVTPLYRQVEAGLWAIDYLRDATCREEYRVAIRGNSDDIVAWSIIANAFYRQGDASLPALDAYLTLLRLRPEMSLGRKLVPIAIQAERSDKAIQLLESLATLKPPDSGVLARLCQFYLEENKLTEAEEIANRILGLDPEHTFALQSLAFIAQTRQEWRDASSYSERAGAWKNALAFAVLAKDRTAIERLQKHITLDTVDTHTLMSVGWVLFVNGEEAKALRYWQKAVGAERTSEGKRVIAWLNAITRLSNEPDAAMQELEQLIRKENRSLPPDLVQATEWILSRAKHRGESFTSVKVPVITEPSRIGARDNCMFALLPSVVLSHLMRGELPSAELLRRRHPSKSWGRVRAVAYAELGNLDEALQALPASDVSEVGISIRSLGLRKALARKDWKAAVRILEQMGSGVFTADTIQALRSAHHDLWQAQELNLLASLLRGQTSLRTENQTEIHHDLALVLTRLAILQDEKKADGELWLRAMSHWAVTLSDDDYWARWQNKRAKVYGQSVSPDDIMHVREKVVPEFLHTYHKNFHMRKDLTAASSQPDREFLAAFIYREVKLCIAMRHVLVMAKSHRVQVPNKIATIVSPTLLKLHSEQRAIDQLLRLLPKTKAPDFDQKLLKQAFSELSDVYVLMESRAYEAALRIVRDLYKQKPKNLKIRRELVHVMTLRARELIDQGQWSQAQSLGEEALQMQPQDSEIERCISDAAVGLAKQRRVEGERLEAIQLLQSTRRKLKHYHAELDATLCDLLTDHAAYLNDEASDLNGALKYVQQALKIDANHAGAKRMAGIVYHKMALKHVEAKRFQDAKADAQRALDIDPTDEQFDFWAWTCCQHAIHLASMNQYLAAIRIVEGLLNLQQLPNSVNLPKLLSALYTDYGAVLWNSGQDRYGAKKQWELALRLDPTNTVARSNLRQVGGVWW